MIRIADLIAAGGFIRVRHEWLFRMLPPVRKSLADVLQFTYATGFVEGAAVALLGVAAYYYFNRPRVVLV